MHTDFFLLYPRHPRPNLFFGFEIFPTWDRLRRWILHILLKEQVEKEEQRFGFEDHDARFVIGIAIDVLMHAAVLDDARIACFPVVALAIVNVVPLAFQNIKDRAVHMPMLLPMRSWGKHINMRLNRLRDRRALRVDNILAKFCGTALEGLGFALVDTRLFQ